MPERRYRRTLLLAGGAWLVSAATASLAQAPKELRRIAVLLRGTHAAYRSRLDAFRAELMKLGHIEGRDISIEARWAGDRPEELESLAAELVLHRPAVILTASSAGVAAVKKVTSTIPVVFATAGNPVEQGFVASLQRPGANITGIMVHLGLAAKMVEVAREAFPQAQRLAILVHESDPIHKVILDMFVSGAQRFKFEPVIVRVMRADDLARAFDEISKQKAEALYLPEMAFTTSHIRQLVDRSLKAKLSLLSSNHDTTMAGGLFSYGTPREENYRRAALLVDKILRGAKPGDLPVEQPERFQLIVNRKTAKAIGVTLLPVTMLRADRIID